MTRKPMVPEWDEILNWSNENAWFCHTFIRHPIMWKVNCCKERHRIIFTPTGKLLFLDHPKRSDWERIKILQALHQRSSNSYACRCHQIRDEWRRVLTNRTTISSLGKKSYFGNLSGLPNHPGVELHSNEPRIREELRNLSTVKQAETLLSLRKTRYPGTGEFLVLAEPPACKGASIRETVRKLILFHLCRDEMKRRYVQANDTKATWNKDIVLIKCQTTRRHRREAMKIRKEKRRKVYDSFEYGKNLFNDRTTHRLERAKFENLTFVSCKENHFGIQAVYLRRKFNRLGYCVDTEVVWVWAYYEEASELWYLSPENEDQLIWEAVEQ